MVQRKNPQSKLCDGYSPSALLCSQQHKYFFWAFSTVWASPGPGSSITVIAVTKNTQLWYTGLALQRALQVPGLLPRGGEIHRRGAFHITSCRSCSPFSLLKCMSRSLSFALVLRKESWVLSEGEEGSLESRSTFYFLSQPSFSILVRGCQL